MQNEKIKDKETVMIPVPAELLLEAGIYEGDPMQMYADGEQYVFRDNTEPMKTYLSDNGYSEQEIAEEVENIEWQKAIFLDIDIG